LTSAQNTVGVGGEGMEQIELHTRQSNLLAIGVVKVMRCEVECASAHLDYLRAVLCQRTGGWNALSLATEYTLDACKQFPRLEGLRYIVVRPHLKPDDPVDNLTRCGQHYYANVLLRPELARERKSIFTRQIQIHQNKIDMTCRKDLAHAVAVARDKNIEATMFEVVTNGLTDVLVIVHHQNRSSFAHSSPFACNAAETEIVVSAGSFAWRFDGGWTVPEATHLSPRRPAASLV
jgi:hypothetical protein